MATICVIGLMSGTSMDGIDIAMLTTDGEQLVERGPSFFVGYEPAFRQRIEAGLVEAKSIERRDERPGDLAALERDITLRHAEAVRQFLARHPRIEPELIGFHGQTVLHRPQKGLTVQLGDGALLAGKTGLPVIYDMRANDMAHGGQGAPLAPAYHTALAHCLPEHFRGSLPVVFVNIGGISNVTFVPAQGEPVAFDSGPGNALIDQWVQRVGGIPYDADGAVAREGSVVVPVVQQYLESPFFAKPAPKSLDRGDFTLDFVEGLDLADGARTLAAVSADAILLSARQMPAPPKLWIVCGGGRKNPHIVRDMAKGAQRIGSDVILAEDAGLDGDAMEAGAWAYLADRSRRRRPLSFPSTTGCRTATTGGVLARP